MKFERLDFGETSVLDSFYNADVAIVDLSVAVQQRSLVYHLGVRESFGMKQNILLYHDVEPELTLALKSSLTNYTLITYAVPKDSPPKVTSEGPATIEAQKLSSKITQLFRDMEIQSK